MTSLLDRLLGRPEPPREPSAKAVVSVGPWSTGISLSSVADTPQRKAALYLRAYRVGWFYKAGNRIANDISTLDWSISEGDAEEGDDESVLDRPDASLPFGSLAPIDQFQRLLERPNPGLTGRALLQRTAIHLDFTGNACWYLEGGNLPTAIYPIAPSRMWESRDKAGNLIGWVMDRDQPSGGVPFEASEVLWFSTGGAHDDIWGQSVVEAVYSQVPLTDLMARHTADVLTTGGRLAGMLWPKDRPLDEAEYQDAQKAWRNVSSDPNAARRLLIFPEPMEYASGASTPAEIGIPELASLNRDEILTAFPISPYQLGVPTPGGLNSGEVRREDRRDYWEGTIHPRADLIEETVQIGLLKRYEEAEGTTYDYELAEPNLDDAASLVSKAEAFKALVGIGLDPKESVKAVGLDHIKWTGLPAILDPAQQQMMAEQRVEALARGATEEPNQPPPRPTKAAEAIEEREQATRSLVALADKTIRDFFRGQRARVKAGIEALPASKAERKAMKADPIWWDAEREDEELTTAMRTLYKAVGRAGMQVAADQLQRIIRGKQVDPIIDDLLTFGGKRIKSINEHTLMALTIELAEGTRRGYSIPQLIDGVPEEGYRGVLGTSLENGTPVFGDARAEMIARTETRASYNRASIQAYSSLGVEEFIAYDGDEDPECAARNGQTFSVEAALAEDEAEHPNGTLTMSAVVDKSYHEPAAPIVQNFILGTDAVVKALEPPPPAHITVEPAPVVIEPTDLTPLLHALADIDAAVKAIEIAPVIAASPVTDVRIVDDVSPKRVKRILRGPRSTQYPAGPIEGIEE